MSGHISEAERCLAGVTRGDHKDGSPLFRTDEPETLAAAQVHATLAVAEQQAALVKVMGEIRNELIELRHRAGGPK